MSRGEEKLHQPFIVIKKGRYFGIATTWDVIVAVGQKNVENVSCAI